jgi:hypothetical protein
MRLCWGHDDFERPRVDEFELVLLVKDLRARLRR